MFRPLCKTVNGGVCKFPFSFHNETFSACTDFWHHGSWCATIVDSFGQVQAVGQCGEHCDFVPFVNPAHPSTSQSESHAMSSQTHDAVSSPTAISSSSASSSSSDVSSSPVSSASSQPDGQSSPPIASSSTSSQPDHESSSSVSASASSEDAVSSSSDSTAESSATASTDDTTSEDGSASSAPQATDISSLGREFTGAAPSACLTTSGPDPGRQCQFPFTYMGRTYAGCTYSFGIPQSWCSTATSEAGDYIPGSWGYCSHPCPVHHDASKECLTVGGPAAGELCVFPFVSKGKFHWGCTRLGLF